MEIISLLHWLSMWTGHRPTIQLASLQNSCSYKFKTNIFTSPIPFINIAFGIYSHQVRSCIVWCSLNLTRGILFRSPSLTFAWKNSSQTNIHAIEKYFPFKMRWSHLCIPWLWILPLSCSRCSLDNGDWEQQHTQLLNIIIQSKNVCNKTL